jgi:hypothetical protein
MKDALLAIIIIFAVIISGCIRQSASENNAGANESAASGQGPPGGKINVLDVKLDQSFCDSIGSEPYKKSCNAILAMDNTSCYAVEDKNARKMCIIEIAIKKDSLEACDGLVGIYQALYYDYEGPEVFSSFERYAAMQQCYFEYAKNHGDVSVCEHAYPKKFINENTLVVPIGDNAENAADSCRTLYAIYKKNVSICDDTPILYGTEATKNYEFIGYCHAQYALSLDDESACSSIPPDTMWYTSGDTTESCYEKLAVKRGDISLCQSITDQNARYTCIDSANSTIRMNADKEPVHTADECTSNSRDSAAEYASCVTRTAMYSNDIGLCGTISTEDAADASEQCHCYVMERVLGVHGVTCGWLDR